MEEKTFDEITASEQRVYEKYKAIEAENFHLKNQLKRKNKEITNLKRGLAYWKHRAIKKEKPRYKNERRSSKRL